ncbi:MAG: glutamine synthetase, type [Frankiales bacterium]|nr:glutamine synthetase, type [Frankiales bacterium]
MFTSAKEVLSYIEKEDVEMVDVRFCDLPGVMQHFTVPAGSFGEEVFTDGLGFDCSSIRGFQEIHESDMLLLPDPTTARIDPFRVRKTLIINFFIHDPLTGEAYSRDPRNIAKKAEAYLRGTGIADTAYFGAEAEFHIFDSIRYDTTPGSSYHFIDAEAAAWNTGREEEGGNLGYKPRMKGGYFPVSPTDHYADLRDEIAVKLEEAGMIVERGQHEVG